ncbi:MAG: hypothetical protein LBK58_12035 [Prevotellaceae bacterium]|jgi:acetylornithine/succinyldiaminopimelate/putrescine aminotransferase|nr:hypothetical protein [Prevotellaceae bacterium]
MDTKKVKFETPIDTDKLAQEYVDFWVGGYVKASGINDPYIIKVVTQAIQDSFRNCGSIFKLVYKSQLQKIKEMMLAKLAPPVTMDTYNILMELLKAIEDVETEL